VIDVLVAFVESWLKANLPSLAEQFDHFPADGDCRESYQWDEDIVCGRTIQIIPYTSSRGEPSAWLLIDWPDKPGHTYQGRPGLFLDAWGMPLAAIEDKDMQQSLAEDLALLK